MLYPSVFHFLEFWSFQFKCSFVDLIQEWDPLCFVFNFIINIGLLVYLDIADNCSRSSLIMLFQSKAGSEKLLLGVSE